MKKLLIFTVMAAVIALLSASVSDAAQPSNETARLFEEGENFYNAQAYNSAFDRLSRAAGQGHTRAQVYVAYMYANGLGVSKDEAMAIEYWKMAARQGDAVAQNNLTSRGIRDWSGGSVQMPEIKATLPLEAVQKLFDEGETFYNAQAYNSAFERFYSAANQGHTKAQVYLAFMYANGLRVQKDEAKAIEYWKMAARKGDAVAQSNLTSRGIRDWGGSAPAATQTPPPRTPPPAQQTSQPATTQTPPPAQQISQPAATPPPPRTPAGQATQPSDDAQKLFDEGEAFYNTQAYNSAFELFSRAANLGHARAQVYLAFMYANGLRVPKDEAKAIEYWKMAARQGDAVAQSNLTNRGIRDWGSAPTATTPPPQTPAQPPAAAKTQTPAQTPAVQMPPPPATQTTKPPQKPAPQTPAAPPQKPAVQPTSPPEDLQKLFNEGMKFYNAKDYPSALDCFSKAAAQGHVVALFHVGIMHEKGEGVARNFNYALDLYHKTAESGYAVAQYDLGVMYSLGDGVNQDDSKAVYWYRKAADQGFPLALNNLGVMYEAGRGAPKDMEMAIEYYKMAAKLGEKNAQNNLTRLGVEN